MSRLITVILLFICALVAVPTYALEASSTPNVARYGYLSLFTADELVSYLARYNITANTKVSRQQLQMATISTIINEADKLDLDAPIEEFEPQTTEEITLKRKRKRSKKQEEFVPPPTNHTIEVQYCVTLGFKEACQTMEKILQRQLPGILEFSHGYMGPSDPLLKVVVPLLRYSFVYAILLILTAKFWKTSNPSKGKQIVNNNRKKIFFLGLALSLVSFQLQVSGAFEVFLDGKQIYSRLGTGDAPDIHVVMELIIRHLQRGAAQKSP